METIGIVLIVMAAVASFTKIIDVVTTIRGAKKQARFSLCIPPHPYLCGVRHIAV